MGHQRTNHKLAAELQNDGCEASACNRDPPGAPPAQARYRPSVIADSERYPAEDEENWHFVRQKMKDIVPDDNESPEDEFEKGEETRAGG